MHTTPESLSETLDSVMPRNVWSNILLTLNLTGVADSRHLQYSIGLTRGQLVRKLEHLQVHTLDGDTLISQLDHSIRRPIESNRPAAIYRIEKGGTKLLRYLGYSDVRASGLKDDVDILHALAMLTINQAATSEKDIAIITDRLLEFNSGRLRPDHQVLHTDGELYLFEVEQTAYKEIVPRIRRGLDNRHAFFSSPQGREYSNAIRVVFNIKEGNAFFKTLQVWREAMRGWQKDNGKKLAFTLWAIPMKRFLQNPQWGRELSGEWTQINPDDDSFDEKLERRSSMFIRSHLLLDEEAALLEALADEWFQTMPEVEWGGDYNMFRVARAIYDGSHRKERYRYIPIISVRLLGTYLGHHEELRLQLTKALHFNSNRISWVPTNVLNRMRLVFKTFLMYHGWSMRNSIMEVYPYANPDRNSEYSVKVHLYGLQNEMRIRNEDYEEALAWVLFALFEYGQEIGIGRPAFW